MLHYTQLLLVHNCVFFQWLFRGVIEQRVRMAYITMLSAISQICTQSGHPGIPILVRSYDYPVPDGHTAVASKVVSTFGSAILLSSAIPFAFSMPFRNS